MTFQTSRLHISPELTKYLKSLLEEPYNKYCIDCKINISTHAIVFYGIFVCHECMLKIKNTYGVENTYPKKVIGEYWDDYQLLCMAKGIGGNLELYQLLQEYELEDKDFREKYDSKIFKWYRKRRQCLMDRIPFIDEKPPKNWGEWKEKKK